MVTAVDYIAPITVTILLFLHKI